MKHLLPLFKEIRSSDERGLSLLEYAIGAAVLTGIVFVAMTTFGTGMQAYFTNLSTWIQNMTIGSSFIWSF